MEKESAILYQGKRIPGSQWLTWRDPKYNSTLLQRLCRYNDRIDDLVRLIEAGIDIHHADFYDFTALHDAAQCGKVEFVKLLCMYGANQAKETRRGNSALYTSLSELKFECAFVLISNGSRLYRGTSYEFVLEFQKYVICCRDAVVALLAMRRPLWRTDHRWDRHIIKEIALSLWALRYRSESITSGPNGNGNLSK